MMINIFQKLGLNAVYVYLNNCKNKNVFWFFIYFLVSLVLILPLCGNHLYAGAFSDLLIHTRLVKSAYHTLFQEFAFPPFYVNDLALALEPIFLYYSVTIYSVSSLFMLVGFSAYNSLLLGTASLYSLGAFGIFLTARFLRCDLVSAFLAGLTYLYAPYFLVDIYARSAYSEVSAIGVLPLAFYAVVRLLANNGKRWGIRTALLTAWLLVSHKIFFPWFCCFSALFLILNSSIFNLKKLVLKRLIPLIFWIGVGMLLSLPYWSAGFLNLPNLKIAHGVGLYFESLSNWKLVLKPYFSVSSDSTTPNLATQYGLPVLLGFILLFLSKQKLKLKLSLFTIGIITLLLQTNAGNMLSWFPKIFLSIQFPYRLLVFSVLFGSLSAALGLHSLTRWKYVHGLKWTFFIIIIAYLILYYKIPVKSTLTSEMAEEDKIGFYDDFVEKPSLETRKYIGIHPDLWIEQDAYIKLKREPKDQVSFFVSGVVSEYMNTSKPFWVDVLIDSQPWSHQNFTESKIVLEKMLPEVSVPAYQDVKFHFSDYFVPKEVIPNSPDYRKLVLRNCVVKVWKKRDIKVDWSQMSARGNKVKLRKLEMKKEHDYILPVMYSHLLKVQPDFISILPHAEGIILKTTQDGVFDVIISRQEFPFVIRKLAEMVKGLF